MVNYLAGLAAIRPRAFFAAVALGALPKTIAYATLGDALSDRRRHAGPLPSHCMSAPPPAAR